MNSREGCCRPEPSGRRPCAVRHGRHSRHRDPPQGVRGLRAALGLSARRAKDHRHDPAARGGRRRRARLPGRRCQEHLARSSAAFKITVEDSGTTQRSTTSSRSAGVRLRTAVGTTTCLTIHCAVQINSATSKPSRCPIHSILASSVCARGDQDSRRRTARRGLRQHVGGHVQRLTWLRGYEDAYTDWGSNSPVRIKLMDSVLEMQLQYLEKGLDVVGDVIDVAQIADDIAGQQGLLISPRSYRRLLKPIHKQLCDYIHSHSNAKVFMHSCGAIRQLLPDLIEVGVRHRQPRAGEHGRHGLRRIEG